ncbi:MAG: radical SAM protein [Bacillota bacterium]|nr:radical SAM protein [Bacillota bacterium]
MEIKKIRFIEPGNLPYRKSIKNLYVYDKYIRTPSTGLLTLTTIVKQYVNDTLMYSESISQILWGDVLDSDIIFIGFFTFAANRAYELAQYIRQNSNAILIFGGLHPTLNHEEACNYCDYVLLGEGDESVLEIIKAIESDNPVAINGIAYKKDDTIIVTPKRNPPKNIDTIPDYNLLYRFQKMVWHNTIWPQVHASRGCPHNCDYCALIHIFGRKVRTRTPENVVKDIRSTIDFYDSKHHRLAKVLWITDDNFFADREWAVSVLKAIIGSEIKYKFTIQARYEIGYDDEMLELLKQAGFIEIAMGIEFLEDEAFENYHKKSTYNDIIGSVKNIQKHGLRVRGLFIVGADNHAKGVGERLANFVIENNICGVLIQSMYFIPGTPVYETHKDKLIHTDWSKCVGNVVHYPENISPYDLQKEIIYASKKIYSLKRLLYALFKKRGIERILFIGEFFWQKSVRADLKKELPYLKKSTQESGLYGSK